MIWTEIEIKSTPEAEEAIANIFYDAGAKGVAIESPNDLSVLKNREVLWDYVDESVLNRDPKVSIIKGYFDETKDVKGAIAEMKERIDNLPSFGLDTGKVEMTVTEVDEDEWANSWKQYFEPTEIGENFVIKPSWKDYSAQEENMVIEIDPGMAFGSGLHETTQLCIVNLEKYVQEGDTVFDIGCGSGILSLAAGRLKAKKVIAVDVDSLAVETARENVAHNHLDQVIDVRHGDLLDVIDEKADVIVANILAEVIVNLASQIKPYIKYDGILIASGIILEKIEPAVDSLLENDFDIMEIERKGEWVAVIAQFKGTNA